MFRKMEALYTDLSEFFSFDKQKYTLEEFFGDVKTFKDSFYVSDFLMEPYESNVLLIDYFVSFNENLFHSLFSVTNSKL